MDGKPALKGYSPIAPIGLLDDLQQHAVLGNYLLVLAHDVLDYPVSYSELLSRPEFLNSDSVVILDNGVIEKGIPLPIHQLEQAARDVNANYVILPDFLGDMEATIEASKAALAKRPEMPWMKIVQAREMRELRECVIWMANEIPGHAWSVPRFIANEFHTRMVAIEEILKWDPEAQIHLLGMSQSFSDDLICARQKSVIGIDSANPVVMGQRGVSLRHDPYHHYDREDFWTHRTCHKMSVENVRFMRELINK